MSAGTAFVVDVALVLGVGAATGAAARALKLPSIVGYLLAGLIVGPYLPIPLFADPQRVEALATFGVVLVMFAVGLEFRVGRMLRVLPVSGFAALVQIATMLWCGFSIGRLLGWDTVGSAFLGAALAISSTMVVTGLFAQSKVDPLLREHVLGVLVLQDVAAIVLIAAMTAVAAGTHLGPAALTLTVVELLAALVGLLAAGMLVVPRLVRAVVARGWSEAVTVLAVGLAFAFAVFADLLGYSVALGAFVAGVVVAESGQGAVVEQAVAPLRDVFAAIFFVSIGMTVDPAAALVAWPVALLVAVVVVFGQLLSVTLASLASGLPLGRAVTAGIALGQIGEFSFILAEIGRNAGVVPAALGPALVAVATLTALTTPLLLARAERLVHIADTLIPGRVHRLLTVHQRWVELLRAHAGADASRWRRTLLGLMADGVGLILLGVGTSASFGAVAALVQHHLGLSAAVAEPAVVLLVLALAAPLVIGLLANARRLAVLTANIVLGGGRDDGDYRALLRQLVHAIVHLGVLVAIGAPAIALLRPLLVAPWAAPLFVVAVLIAALLVWRRATLFEGALRSGVEHVAGLLAPGADGPMRTPEPALTGGATAPLGPGRDGHIPGKVAEQALLDQLLPGLDGVSLLTLGEVASGRGMTLAELDLRARTGVTVVAIRHASGALALPNGRERLEAGDTLALLGPEDRIAAARLLLDHDAAAAPTAAPAP